MINLINVGATDRLRKKLKKFGMNERMIHLQKCIPFIKDSKRYIKFFKENFSAEIGALVIADGDIDVAVDIYKKASK